MRRLNNYGMKDKIIDQIIRIMQKSLIGYEVLGTPEKRTWNLHEIAMHLRARKFRNKKQDKSQ